MLFNVLSNLKHDGELYVAGTQIEMDPADAKLLVRDGVLESAEDSDEEERPAKPRRTAAKKAPAKKPAAKSKEEDAEEDADNDSDEDEEGDDGEGSDSDDSDEGSDDEDANGSEDL